MSSFDAYQSLRKEIILEVYSEAYDKIQSLGELGLHCNNEINRQDALDALKEARDKVLDKS